jgi:quinohemoprotein amine dehydrogenase
VGEEQLVLISGSGLSGEVEFGDGILVQEMLSADANHALVRVKAVDDMKLGMTAVSIGGASSGIKVHSGVDSIVVEPAYAIARVGGNGPTADLKAAFRAVALSGGEQLGYLPSASWRVEPFDEIAERDGDAQFAGVMSLLTRWCGTESRAKNEHQ